MEPSVVTAERLYAEIARPGVSVKPNFVFSPLSIFGVFHAAQKGAAGETKEQMDALVGPNERFSLPELVQPPKQEVVVDVANRLYVQKDLESNERFNEFKELLEADGHTAETMNFADSVASATKINSFVANATRDHIKNLISSSALSEATRLVLVNALYFKAPWLSQFDEKQTGEDVFITPGGPKTVSFMKGKVSKAPPLYALKKEGAAVGIPYADPRLRLYIFMPEDLEAFESELVSNPQTVEKIIEEMELLSADREFEEELHVALPKFKLSAEENKVDLVDIFSKLGASDMFDMGRADFSGITGNRDLFVSSYVHQADIDVDEKGTEATAATAMVMMLRAMPMPKTPIHVVFNRPFMFQLRFQAEGSSLMLFSGRVADPSVAQ